jgi:hypothetical protein
MKRLFFLLVPGLLFCLKTEGQNAGYDYVYQVFQQHCTSCHGNTNPAGGLDLLGTGSDDQQRGLSVYQSIMDQPPSNSHADAQGYKLVYPGNAWRSSIFRQINNGLQPNMELDPAEGDRHQGTMHTISEAEKEALRQWVLFGAPRSGNVIDTSLLRRYYAGEAEPSFTTPPVAPDASEGFQIHLGPFFLESQGEVEYFWKYPTGLTEDVEVDKIEVLFGPYSHHFIMFEYANPTFASQKKNGFRLDNAHSTTELVTVQQYSDTLELPKGSAFFWEKGNILDLNTHYINYSPTRVAACEVYINVFTKPKGTAAQEMEVALVANPSIWIPNDGQPYTFEEHISNNDDQVFIWALTSHTHQWGTDFNVYTRNRIGQRNDLIFDAEYADGDPTKFFFGYDYRHPPIRYYDDYVILKRGEGLIYEASYTNTGPRAVGWGDTSEDEMMVMAFFYLEDTGGVSTVGTTSQEATLPPLQVRLGPNPVDTKGYIEIDTDAGTEFGVRMYDLHGKAVDLPVHQERNGTSHRFTIDAAALSQGVYLIEVRDGQSRLRYASKWFVH